MSPDDNGPGRRSALWLAVIVALAAGVRLAACFNEFWLDELWSLIRVREMHSPLAVFGLHHDNNHFLNSLFLYFMPDTSADWLYRLPALVTGVLAVLVAGPLVARQLALGGRPTPPGARLAGALAIGASYMMIHYASEARGYGPAMFLCSCAFYCAVRGAEQYAVRWALGYGLSIVLAVLAHAVALHVLGGLLAWTAVRTLRNSPSGAAATVRLLTWHALPVGTVAVLYFTHLNRLDIGGGPDHSLLTMVANTAAYTLGLPIAAAPIALTVAVLVAVAAMYALARDGNDVWIAYAVGIFVAPAMILAVTEHPLLFERYFISCASLWLLLAAGFVVRFGKAIAIATGVLFVIGNGVHTAELLRLGRGSYREALTWISDRTPGAEVTYGSDHVFRNPLVVGYHAVRMRSPKSWTVLPGPPWQDRAPQWFLAHDQKLERPANAVLTDERGVAYRHEATFRSGPMSGWNWFVFRAQQ